MLLGYELKIKRKMFEYKNIIIIIIISLLLFNNKCIILNTLPQIFTCDLKLTFSGLYFIQIIQSVPLATEPGISLIILTPMKILQRNLNSTCYDVVTLLTQCGKSASDLVALSSLVVKLLKECRVQ